MGNRDANYFVHRGLLCALHWLGVLIMFRFCETARCEERGVMNKAADSDPLATFIGLVVMVGIGFGVWLAWPSSTPTEKPRNPLGLYSHEQDGRVIRGVVVNNGDDCRYAEINFHVFDDTGARVGTALANITDFRAGQTWNFEATCINRFDRYQFVSLTSK